MGKPVGSIVFPDKDDSCGKSALCRDPPSVRRTAILLLPIVRIKNVKLAEKVSGFLRSGVFLRSQWTVIVFQGFENLNQVHRRKNSIYTIWKSCAIDGIHTCSYILLLCNHWRSGQISRWRWTTKLNLFRDIITAATSWINLTLCFES